jgi:hypothetical protein
LQAKTFAQTTSLIYAVAVLSQAWSMHFAIGIAENWCCYQFTTNRAESDKIENAVFRSVTKLYGKKEHD